MIPITRIKKWERGLRSRFNTDLSTPENRRRARIYNLWFDHEILRTVWHNFFRVAPGVYRSNHPTRARFEKYAKLGIRTVLNLRGAGNTAHYLYEKEYCDQLGLTLVDRNLYARAAASREEILGLIDTFRALPRPFVMHCKSGADRAGFASVIYLLAIEDSSVRDARRMLSPRFVHFRFMRTGILDYILDLYEIERNATSVGFEDWIRDTYDPAAIQAAFEAMRRK